MSEPIIYELESKNCPSCQYTSDSKMGVRQHHKSTHGESVPNLVCHNCDEPFFERGRDHIYCDDCKSIRYEGCNNPNYSGAKEEASCKYVKLSSNTTPLIRRDYTVRIVLRPGPGNGGRKII